MDKFKCHKKYILVIDDEELMCDLIQQVLEMRGYNVKTFTNSVEAKEEIKLKKNYDVIVADIRMPKISGIDLLKTSNAQDMGYQFILVTGFYNLLSPDMLKTLNPFGFIKKPFDINTLIDTIDRACKEK